MKVDHLFIAILIVIIALLLWQQHIGRKQYEANQAQIDNQNAQLQKQRNALRAKVTELTELRQLDAIDYRHKLASYHNLSKLDKAQTLAKAISNDVVIVPREKDTVYTIDTRALDSLNVILLQRNYYQLQTERADSIIAKQAAIMQVDSVLLSNTRQQLRQQKKQLRRARLLTTCTAIAATSLIILIAR